MTNWPWTATWRDPVAPARTSQPVRLKKDARDTVWSAGSEVSNVAGSPGGETRCHNTCGVTGDPKQATFHQVTDAVAQHAVALRLIEMEPETNT